MTDEIRPSILVVEDENVVAMDLVSCLERLEYPVAGVAASGEDALTLAASEAPGLVLMDIHLRGEMDGIRAAEHIQAKLHVPVVYVTAYSDEATLKRARVTYPFGYVLKPFEERELEVAIQVALFRHRLEQALRDSEKRLEAILASIGDAVVAIDTDRRITFLNRAAETLLGWKSSRAKGRLASDVLKGSLQPDGLFRLTRDSAVIPVELVEAPVRDSSGKPTGYVIAARDMSERIRAQEAHDRELVERAARASAEREHQRARLQSEISLMLADITQYGDMKTALHGMAELITRTFADWCVLDIEDKQGPLRVTAHVDPEKVACVDAVARLWPPDPNLSHATCVDPESAESGPHSAGIDVLLARVAPEVEQREALRTAGMASFISVPLRARQRVVGALRLVTAEAKRRYQEADVVFAQQIAERVALAIDNARLYREAQEARAAAERLYEAEQRARGEAETLLRVADTLSAAQLDLDAVVQRVTDEATVLVGASFGALFYNVTDANGESYFLYTLSGAPKEAFEQFGLPRNTPLFGPTFWGEGVLRSADVRTDPRYGKMAPHYGMPAGHLPVRSYLAVPVAARSGEVIGGLFFGHPECDVFTERAERLAVAIAAQAAVAIDNGRLYEGVRRAADERAMLLEAERTARAEVERVSLMKDEFLATVSHELRTPLNAILGWSELLLTRGVDDSMKSALETIARNARSQTRLIDDLLDMSRIVSGKVMLDVQRLNPADVVKAAADAVRLSAERKSIELKLDLDRDGAPVLGDSNRLQQVVGNLLSNAIKFTPQGGKVGVSLKRQSAYLEIIVSDTGIGINPAFLPYIYERFRQADSSSTRRHGGLGLGLSIVKQLVELHGGSVRAASAGEGQGTTFVVSLPVSGTQEERVRASEGPKAALEGVCIDLTDTKVLVIDDEPDARELICTVLNDCNAETAVAASAAEGLERVRVWRPDVIVSDISMPEQDGYKFIRQVRSLPPHEGGRTPAAALTAFARSEDRTRALLAGYQVHVSKPIEPQELVAIVAALRTVAFDERAQQRSAESTERRDQNSVEHARSDNDLQRE